ncbi:MAG: methylenetetrahydrofolate--tRNA-(uracil(54)-C(5))-methyltransferase (FADH(2)-oxidizing) TrmFO [Proteobacteria bacterium]|nr:methylenetetrahydrofolate--tRNA-(uracil(54)-C(5))-methyltransferase (FADH(2)-oxidizing) TrmFO [Pseudomonadota bacterium]NCA28828.1 methylenetetrahydrofolate--tRNA-(uracil(54)-C(5))-methyltransferase (FADH(2)-oxidizing) TrmFO [Pseudomonadota bacterium]
MSKVNVIGAGLAGSECAWQLASRGIDVELFEMRTESRQTFAHRTANFAELVCSNSLRSDELSTAIGLLHHEMRFLNSLIMSSADANKVPAGSALAVDREGFSKFIETKLLETKKVKILRQEILELPVDSREIWVIATGPLTSDALSKSIQKHSDEKHLAFFDAIAPIIFKDSINFSKAWFQSRYDKGSGVDYINCPLDKEQYYQFVDDLLRAEKTEFKEWEKDTPYFNGCLPIEEMARRGAEVLRFGPMKPVGLTNPHFAKSPEGTPLKNRKEKPYAVVQLRQDNKSGTIYNMVGFQTKMKYAEQQRIFRTITGLENAEFARLGGIHRNTFINSPKLLDEFGRFKKHPNIYFAGQITGVEGYVESASMGLITGIFIANFLQNPDKKISRPNNKTALGSLLNHIAPDLEQQKITQENDYQPMNVNFGLFEPLADNLKRENRKEAYGARALDEIRFWHNNIK